jgi:hypothetical protein
MFIRLTRQYFYWHIFLVENSLWGWFVDHARKNQPQMQYLHFLHIKRYFYYGIPTFKYYFMFWLYSTFAIIPTRQLKKQSRNSNLICNTFIGNTLIRMVSNIWILAFNWLQLTNLCNIHIWVIFTSFLLVTWGWMKRYPSH